MKGSPSVFEPPSPSEPPVDNPIWRELEARRLRIADARRRQGCRKGVVLSDEIKAKMAEGQRRRWAIRRAEKAAKAAQQSDPVSESHSS
jgi:hypothetical protein